MEKTTGHGQDNRAAAAQYDPGPVPLVVEPETPPVSTIPVTPRTHLEIARHGDCTRLTLVSVQAGARVATDMPPQAVDALVWALVTHTPAPYLIAPALPEEVTGRA